MDIDSATAEFAFHADAQHTSMPTVHINTKAGIQAQNSVHQTSQLSNSDSMESLSKISTRPSQCSLSGSRKFTPVFDDFATAHSSITSGNVKSRISNRSNVDLPLHNRSISVSQSQEFQIRPLKAVKRNEFSLEEPPLPPIPVALKDTKTKDTENRAFSTRNFDKVTPTSLPDTNARDPRTPTISGKSNPLRSISYTPVSNAGNKYAAKWPFSSINNELDTSSARRYYSGSFVPESDLLSPPQAPGRSANLDGSSPYYEQPKYQPSLFDSSPDPTVQGLVIDDAQGLESFANYEENIEHYYGYDTGYGGSHEDHDLVVFSPLAPGFDDQNQSSSSRSSPHSEGSTVVHIVEDYAKGDGESEMSFYEDGSSDDGIPLPGQIPTFTKATHGSPMICPSQESVNKFSTANYGRPTFRTSPTSGEPPNTGLPQVPAEPDRAYLHDVSSGGLAHSSSYGDTRILLDMTQKSKAMNNVSQSPSHGPSPQQPSDIVEEPAYPAAHFRLERDISIALRGLSDDDDASMKSFVPKQRRVEEQTSSSFESVIKSLRSDQKRISKIFKDGFYSSLGSPSRLQVQNGNCIRIPISHGMDRATSPEISHRQVSDSSAMVAREDDGNDWETVVTGSVMFGREHTHPYGEMTFNETGSSIANFSDHKGDSSSGPILAGFASSEQVLQHPARSNDHYEKHPRSMRDTSMSIFLPRRSQFSAGGFPSNAFRTPKKMLDSITSSLSPEAPRSSHRNYARLDNAEPITGSPCKPKIRDRGQQHLSISTAMDGDFSVRGSFAGPVSRSKPWIDGAHNQAQYRPDSYMQMIIAANNGKIPHYVGNTETHTVGSSIADASTVSDTGSFDQQAQGTPAMDVYNPYVQQSLNHGFKSQQRNYAGDRSTSRTHTPFIKGPPGAFYTSLRSKADTRRTTEQQEFNTPTRKPYTARRSPRRVPSGIDESPSRMLRPLSLVAEALGPIKPVVVQPRAPLEFQYRSPLAPVKSPQWRGLYSTSQLDHFNASPTKPNKAIGRFNGDTVTSTTSWEVHQGAPCLTAWAHDNSSLGPNTAGQKSKISGIALIMCCIFPPALALMRFGLLDQFMFWHTKGEISHFGKRHKKVAGYLFAAYAVAAIIVVVVVLMFHVARSTA